LAKKSRRDSGLRENSKEKGPDWTQKMSLL
jgi:hypothetical protein